MVQTRLRWATTVVAVLVLVASCAHREYKDQCPLLKRQQLNADMGGYREDCRTTRAKFHEGCIQKIYDLSAPPFKGDGRDATYVFFPEDMTCELAVFYVLAQVKGERSPCAVRFRRYRQREKVGEVMRDLFGRRHDYTTEEYTWHYSREIVACGVDAEESGGIARQSTQYNELLAIIDGRESKRLTDFETLRKDDPYVMLKRLYPFPITDFIPKRVRKLKDIEQWLKATAYKVIDDVRDLAYGDVLVEEGQEARLGIYLGHGMIATLSRDKPVYEKLAASYSGAFRLVPAFKLMGYQPGYQLMRQILSKDSE